MRKPHPAYPLELRLPEGPAQFAGIVGGQPRYTMGSEPIGVDVTIPADLPGWFWDGSFLRHVVSPEDCGLRIDTATFGVPGVFEQARVIMRVRAEFDEKRPPKQLVMEI